MFGFFGSDKSFEEEFFEKYENNPPRVGFRSILKGLEKYERDNKDNPTKKQLAAYCFENMLEDGINKFESADKPFVTDNDWKRVRKPSREDLKSMIGAEKDYWDNNIERYRLAQDIFEACIELVDKYGHGNTSPIDKYVSMIESRTETLEYFNEETEHLISKENVSDEELEDLGHKIERFREQVINQDVKIEEEIDENSNDLQKWFLK